MSKEQNFQEKLNLGKTGEDKAYTYLRENNHYVDDNRRQRYEDGGGPRLLGTRGMIVLPDFTVYNIDGDNFAVDVKVKNRVYLIDGKFHFTVDKKFEDYLKAVQIKKLDYLALLFVYKDKMYFYKDSDLFGTHKYDNDYSTGDVYLFEFDKSKIIDEE
jgi:hypothetical protein